MLIYKKVIWPITFLNILKFVVQVEKVKIITQIIFCLCRCITRRSLEERRAELEKTVLFCLTDLENKMDYL